MASELEEEVQILRYRYALVPPDRGNHTLLVTRRPDVLRLAAPRAVSRSATELVTLTLSLLRFRGDLEQPALRGNQQPDEIETLRPSRRRMLSLRRWTADGRARNPSRRQIRRPHH